MSREQIMRNNIFLIYIDRVVRRYMRITIPAAVLILAAFILPLLGSGPADEDTYMLMINGCIRNWWTVLVHSNNFNPDGEMCLLHLWYLNVDLQIFVFVAFPLALMLLRYPKSACLAAVVVALALNCLISSQVYSHDLLYGFTAGSTDIAKLSRTMKYTYVRPFPHVSSYLTGVLCGYISVQHKNVSLRPILQAALWVTSFGLACFVMFVTYDWNKGHLPGVVVSALYAGFHRHLWSLAFVWPFYACATGRGGLINKFFGWAFFFPLSRLTFAIYLVHFLIYVLRQIRMRTYLNTDEYFLVPDSSPVHLIMPVLTERVRYLLRSLGQDDCLDYESVKRAVLSELKLTPAEYLDRLDRAAKRKGETWAQFASRVRTYFTYYLQVRGADTKETVTELMVADRIKASLSTDGLEYVRLREGENWLKPVEVARVLQTYEQAKGKGRATKQEYVPAEQSGTGRSPGFKGSTN
ncbi:nose resistant to fluoxetine protein 6 [Ixodes scapularis]